MADKSPALAPRLRWETINEPLLLTIYDVDQAIYPAPDLTFDQLQSWATSCPELFLCLRPDADLAAPPGLQGEDTTYGVIIALPLRKAAWEDLLEGRIREHDIDAATMFPPPLVGDSDECEVGLHVFHVERLPGFEAVRNSSAMRLTEIALREIQKRTGERFRSWKVEGYSALTVTTQGHRAFRRSDFTQRYVETLGNISSDPTPPLEELSQDITAVMMERRGNDPF
ncbi:hypothetical protein M406DRAFT_69873 [Cryphonectria parasitica EP155]|uniref:Uncharacterized protein n=1 Tax=Cryphonectria parasitica (strain ATCC 38755 / EP155) TaxID=660469 RepID=A0A9P4Y6R8_CRYP1|nr:uncharacterized protein M406DRAFT_69873 [Cryphonectria parasitica EP155]KAF3767758.1 hypothetical protein M406DRAFT_69873 [Cryphonectria parasitica EP155]